LTVCNTLRDDMYARSPNLCLPAGAARCICAALAGAALQVIGVASAQQADLVVPPAAMSGTLAPVDETFALYAASSGLAEIEGAQLVLKTTRRAEVREYAQKLARDHGKSLDELRRLVAPRGLKIPLASTGRHADMVTKFAGVGVNDRDDAFLLRFGVDAHKETIALFERHSTEGQNPELKRYAQQTLPMLREHMAAAQKLIHAESSAR
jgi:putative membrane protein